MLTSSEVFLLFYLQLLSKFHKNQGPATCHKDGDICIDVGNEEKKDERKYGSHGGAEFDEKGACKIVYP